MSANTNKHDQPIGDPVLNWTPRSFPKKQKISGQYCSLEKLNVAEHITDLYPLYGPNTADTQWTYLPNDKFQTAAALRDYLNGLIHAPQQQHYVIRDSYSYSIVGTIALVRVDQDAGSAEIGYVVFSEKLKRTRMATEVNALLLTYLFDELGYRRCEWKCDALNAPSIRAAKRLGFTYEGTFRQALVYKGRNRDTAWLSIIDHEWPMLENRLSQWLDPTNFQSNGQQQKALAEFSMDGF